MEAWWHKIEAWIKSWPGIISTVSAAIASLVGILRLLPKIHRTCMRFYGNATIAANLGEHMEEMRQETKAQKESMMEEIRGWFAKIDRGQIHLIQTRRLLLDRESATAFFECDPKGGCVWVSRLWRRLTGLDLEDARGNGWELGIAEESREHIAHLWAEAITKSRPFESTVTYVDRQGNTTTMKVLASPIQDESTLDVLGWFGSALK